MPRFTAAITEASKDQANRIEQINQSTDGIDQITQRMAANAEESAAAAEEISAQAEEMKSHIRNLAAIISGAGAHTGVDFKADAGSRMKGRDLKKLLPPTCLRMGNSPMPRSA